MEEGQKPQATGEPVASGLGSPASRLVIAAGLVPEALTPGRRPASEQSERRCRLRRCQARPPPSRARSPQLASLAPYDLPDWTDPPTLQVPRRSSWTSSRRPQPSAAARPLRPPGGPVWRERQEDWNDTDTVLAELASAGPSVTDYEESSSDDPFAYDFLDLDDESSWIAQSETTEAAKATAPR